MNIGSTQPPDGAAQMVQGIESKRMNLQMLMLRKSLQSHEEQASELSQQAEGKGQIIDLRV